MVIERDPSDQRHDHDQAGGIGGDNEVDVFRRWHGQPAALACSKRSVRTRRWMSIRPGLSKQWYAVMEK